MSIFKDIRAMHDKFGVTEWIEKNKNNTELLREFLRFRIEDMMGEEWDELNKAHSDKDPEEIIDGIIDIIVFGVTILDALGVDAQKAWDVVYSANMSKNPGVKPGRPNKWGLPDMIKPEGWVAPTHKDNHGIIGDILQ